MIEKNKIYLGGVETVVIESFPDESIDFTVTSPPYYNLINERISNIKI